MQDGLTEGLDAGNVIVMKPSRITLQSGIEIEKASAPCVVIFDELDSLAKLKSGDGGAGEAILSQLFADRKRRYGKFF